MFINQLSFINKFSSYTMSGALYIEYLQLHYLFLGNFNNAIHFYNMKFNCQFACLSYRFLRQYLNSIYTFISFYTNSYYQSSNNWPFCTSRLSLTFFVPLRLIRIKMYLQYFQCLNHLIYYIAPYSFHTQLGAISMYIYILFTHYSSFHSFIPFIHYRFSYTNLECSTLLDTITFFFLFFFYIFFILA